MNVFDLTIIDSRKILYTGKVSGVILPGKQGSFGVLANHTDIVYGIKAGKIIIREQTDQIKIIENLCAGVFEFIKNTGKLILYET